MRKIKVAIADDHVLFNKGIAAMLKQFEGIDLVMEATDGKELIDLMKKKKPDVILMDLNMPGMDGFEATSYVRSHYPEIKIIALTMYDEERFIIHMMESGANGYLLKNADPDEMEDAIHMVMQTGYYFNDNVSKAMLKGLVNKKKIKPNFNTDIRLTDRDLAVLCFVCKEYTNAEIAEKLFISPRTVEGYRTGLLEKVGVRNTAGLVVYAIKNNLVDL